jgi:hypothetical protein
MGIHRIDYREAKNKNVCKDLRNDILAYFIFVDTKETSPWTEFDIRSTLDSVNVAVNWLNKQAIENKIKLRIRANYHIGKPYATIKRNLTFGSVQKTLTDQSVKGGLKELNIWADNIAKKVGSTLNIPDKDGIPEIKNPKNKERLIAYLRDENNVESVALIFMVNNYYRDDVSVPVNIFNTNDIEFAIVSYKYPAEIAHNILALYGAAPMNKSVYRNNDKKIKQLEQLFPTEIMHDPYAKGIQNLVISPYTRYLIGWTDKYDKQYEKLFTDGIVSY